MHSPWYIAFWNPINLLMLAAAAGAGLLAAWWLFPVGLVLWIIMLLVIARDPSLRINQTIQERAQLAQRFQATFDQLEKTHVRIYNTISGFDPASRRAFQPVQDAVEELTNEAYRLCLRMTPLQNYQQVSGNGEGAQAKLNQYAYQIQSANDTVVRKEYEDARDSLLEKMRQSGGVTAQLDRVDAQLASLASELDSLLSEIVHLQALGSAQVRAGIPAMRSRLKLEAQQLAHFDPAQAAGQPIPPPDPPPPPQPPAPPPDPGASPQAVPPSSPGSTPSQ
jgi:hypothetical protein